VHNSITLSVPFAANIYQFEFCSCNGPERAPLAMDSTVVAPILLQLGCTDNDLQHVLDGMVFLDENRYLKCGLCNNCIDGPGHLRGKKHQSRLNWARHDIAVRAALFEASKGKGGKGCKGGDKGDKDKGKDKNWGKGYKDNHWFYDGKGKGSKGDKGDKDNHWFYDGKGKGGKGGKGGDKGDKDKGKDKNQGKGDEDNHWFYDGKGKHSDDVNWPPPWAFESSSSSASYSSWDRINLDDGPSRPWQ
jgi:hypothetical protein